MKNNSKNIAGLVTDLISPIAEEFGYELWDVEYVKEGAKQILRVTIDSNDGITIEDCEKMHRAIDPVLDEADPIDVAYYLEVSSPGIERELRTDAHIVASMGSKIEVKLFAPLNGSKAYTGVLSGYENGTVYINNGREDIEISRSAISKIKTLFDFN